MCVSHLIVCSTNLDLMMVSKGWGSAATVARVLSCTSHLHFGQVSGVGVFGWRSGKLVNLGFDRG